MATCFLQFLIICYYPESRYCNMNEKSGLRVSSLVDCLLSPTPEKMERGREIPNDMISNNLNYLSIQCLRFRRETHWGSHSEQSHHSAPAFKALISAS